MRCKDGVVFAVEKLVQSKLYEPGANRRYFTIDRHIGMVSVLLYEGTVLYLGVTGGSRVDC